MEPSFYWYWNGTAYHIGTATKFLCGKKNNHAEKEWICIKGYLKKETVPQCNCCKIIFKAVNKLAGKELVDENELVYE